VREFALVRLIATDAVLPQEAQRAGNRSRRTRRTFRLHSTEGVFISFRNLGQTPPDRALSLCRHERLHVFAHLYDR